MLLIVVASPVSTNLISMAEARAHKLQTTGLKTVKKTVAQAQAKESGASGASVGTQQFAVLPQLIQEQWWSWSCGVHKKTRELKASKKEEKKGKRTSFGEAREGSASELAASFSSSCCCSCSLAPLNHSSVLGFLVA